MALKSLVWHSCSTVENRSISKEIRPPVPKHPHKFRYTGAFRRNPSCRKCNSTKNRARLVLVICACDHTVFDRLRKKDFLISKMQQVDLITYFVDKSGAIRVCFQAILRFLVQVVRVFDVLDKGSGSNGQNSKQSTLRMYIIQLEHE